MKIMKIMIAIFFIFFIVSCKNNEKNNTKTTEVKSKNKKPKVIRFVKTKKIEPKIIIKYKIFNSVITPQRDLFLVSQSNGVITKLSFDIGSSVKKNQLLAIIDTSLKKIDLDLKKVMKEEAEHQLKYLKSLMEKDRILIKKNIVNQETFDASKNRVINAGFIFKKARLAYDLAKISYDKSFIYAPFDGIITSRIKQKGDVVTINTPIGRLIDNNNLQAVIGVIWEDLSLIKEYSQNKVIKIISPDNKNCNAEIKGISESTDSITQLYPIKLIIKNCNILNNTQIKVKIPLKEYKNAFEIKRSILELKEKKYYIFLLENNKAINKEVKLLDDNEENMIVKIEGSDNKELNIITDGHIGLKNNEKVKIAGNDD